MLNDMQQRFCMEYAKTANAKQSAISAGYSHKTAKQQGSRLLSNVDVKKRIKEISDDIASSRIAEATEIQETLTSILRGEKKEKKVLVNAIGKLEEYEISNQANQIKSAELLAKMQGVFSGRIDLDGCIKVVFSGEDELV